MVLWKIPLALILSVAPGVLQQAQELFAEKRGWKLRLLGRKNQRDQREGGVLEPVDVHRAAKFNQRRFGFSRWRHPRRASTALATIDETNDRNIDIQWERGSELWWALFLGSVLVQTGKAALLGSAGPASLLALVVPVTTGRMSSNGNSRLPRVSSDPASFGSRWLPHRQAVDTSRPRSSGRFRTTRLNATSLSKRRSSSGPAKKKETKQSRHKRRPVDDDSLWSITRALIPRSILQTHKGHVVGRKPAWFKKR